VHRLACLRPGVDVAVPASLQPAADHELQLRRPPSPSGGTSSRAGDDIFGYSAAPGPGPARVPASRKSRTRSPGGHRAARRQAHARRRAGRSEGRRASHARSSTAPRACSSCISSCTARRSLPVFATSQHPRRGCGREPRTRAVVVVDGRGDTRPVDTQLRPRATHPRNAAADVLEAERGGHGAGRAERPSARVEGSVPAWVRGCGFIVRREHE
jgi:hypothetical protein